MPQKEIPTPYPVIDADPHFSRVLGYMRPNDYLLAGSAAAAGPVLLTMWDKVDPSKAAAGIRSAVRLTGFLGLCGGFLLAYQNSSCMCLKKGWSWELELEEWWSERDGEGGLV
jgi:hypothetical protein